MLLPTPYRFPTINILNRIVNISCMGKSNPCGIFLGINVNIYLRHGTNCLYWLLNFHWAKRNMLQRLQIDFQSWWIVPTIKQVVKFWTKVCWILLDPYRWTHRSSVWLQRRHETKDRSRELLIQIPNFQVLKSNLKRSDTNFSSGIIPK